VANTIRQEAESYRALGNYAQAENDYTNSLAILNQQPGTDESLRILQLVYRGLAKLMIALTRYDEAQDYITRAFETCTTLYGADHYLTLSTHELQAQVDRNLGRHKSAVNHFNIAVKNAESRWGPAHYRVGRLLISLAYSYLLNGDYQTAGPILDRGTDIIRKAKGLNHPSLAPAFRRQARLQMYLSNLDSALVLAHRIIQLGSGRQSDFNPNYGFDCLRLARLQVVLGQIDSALTTFRMMNRNRYRFLTEVFPYASTDQKLRLSRRYKLIDGSLVQLATKTDRQDILSAILEIVINGKAIVLDALAEGQRAARCSDDPQLKMRLDKHRQVCSDIAALSVENDVEGDMVHSEEALNMLYAAKAELERDLTRSCSEFGRSVLPERVSIEQLTTSIPDNSVLLEYVKYRPFIYDRISEKNRLSGQSYMVFAIDKTGRISADQIRNARYVDSIISECRNYWDAAQRSRYTGDLDQPLEELNASTNLLYSYLLAAAVNHLPDGTSLIISPDGRLSLLPFDILSLGRGRYTIDRFQISYVSSGRDLVRLHDRQKYAGRNAVVYADPDFDSYPSYQPRRLLANVPSDRKSVACLHTPFDLLRGTMEEANAVSAILSDEANIRTSVLIGSEASEQSLKNALSPPLILHLATHGFFCDSQDDGTSPLLSTGLALAGANETILGRDYTRGGSEDGLLTALEATSLNLWGTELVVLSACQSGAGSVQSGEGVFGLRRAFQLAGARSLLMSMYDVPDEHTIPLMRGFYTAWLGGASKASALRRAQLKMLEARRKNNFNTHPVFWGGFILVGDPN
jgi:CHAT domain-containing protein